MRTIDGATLMSTPLQLLNFVVDMLISQGLHILAGSPKVGKRWLADSVAKGKKTQGMSTREYRAAAKGESWKFRLINVIDDCVKYAHAKDEFIALMQSEGYGVRWEDTRQNITYTISSGYKCRDDRLHDEKYLKEAMEREFGIRQRLVDGGFEDPEYAHHERGKKRKLAPDQKANDHENEQTWQQTM